MSDIEFNICGDIPDDPVVVEAFPSKGYVSSIAAYYLIKEAGFEHIGSIKVPGLENFVVVHEGEILRPIRIYAKDNIVLVFSEIIITPSLVSEFTDKFIKWLEDIDTKRAVLLASIMGKEAEEEHKILGLSNTPELSDKLDDLDVEKLKEGVLTGVSSTLALNCQEKEIPSISLLVETPYIPDALAAASLLEVLSNLLGLDVDVEELKETGKEFEEKFKEMVKQMNKGQKDYQKLSTPGMYR